MVDIVLVKQGDEQLSQYRAMIYCLPCYFDDTKNRFPLFDGRQVVILKYHYQMLGALWYM